MSSYKAPFIHTFKAGAVIAITAQYHLAKFGAADDEVLLCGAGEASVGVIMTKPCALAGEELEIAGSNGGAKVRVGAAISRGDYFISDAAGKAVVTLTRDVALGQIEEEATAVDQVVACSLF